MFDFLETPRFDAEVSYGSSGGPGFKTFVFAAPSGYETQVKLWDSARGKYLVNETIRDQGDMDVIRALFYVTRGRAAGFRFKDWSDFTFTDELMGIGDGVNRIFTLKKTYGGGTQHEFVRRLFKPVSATVTLKDAGVTISPSHYTVDYTTGTVTINPLQTPALGNLVTASGEFDVPVRFDTDELNASYTGFQLQTWNSIPLVELKL